MKKRVVFVAVICLVLFWLHTFVFPLPRSGSDEESKIDKLFQMSLEELQNVKITTAGKHPERIGDIPASVVLITREDIEAYGYRTLAEILQHIPGLFAIDDYSEDGADFGVRGFWSGVANDNMIFLVNGVHQVNDFHSNYPLNKIIIPVEAIDRIEVIRGPMSVVYGNGAFYGVINIITNDNSYESINIVSGAMGSLKTKKIFARVAGNKNGFSYVFNAALYNSDGVDKPLLDMAGDPAILAALNVPADSRTGGRLENNEKYFNFSGTFKKFTIDMSHSENKREFYFALPSVANGSHDHVTATHLMVKYFNQLSGDVAVEGKWTYSQKRDSFKYDFLTEDFYGVEYVESNAWEAELNIFYTPQRNLDITTGLYYRSVLDVSDLYDLPSFGAPPLENNRFFLSPEDNIVTRALFAQVSYLPWDSFRLVAGLRLEQTPHYGLGMSQTYGADPPFTMSEVYSEEKVEVIPRIAALFYLGDEHIVKLLFGIAINRPSFFQNTQNTLNPDEEDLIPESIETLELNYIGKFSPRFVVSASLFRNVLDNLITRVVKLDEQGNYSSVSGNAGKLVTHGVELTLSTEPFDNFRLELNGILQETKDKRSGFEDISVAYSPRILGYLKASYRLLKFTASVTGNYVGAMDAYWDELKPGADGLALGARIGEKVDSYFVLGANLRFKDFPVDDLFLDIRCSNLLDEDIRYPTFTNNDWAVRGTIGAGRTFLVTLGYRF